jgi:hypothetical protein
MREPAKIFEDLLVKALGYGDISEIKLLLQKLINCWKHILRAF